VSCQTSYGWTSDSTASASRRSGERGLEAVHGRLGLLVEEAEGEGAYAPTLDGLGPVGDGAHADHEHVVVPRLPERAALLALLLLAPVAEKV
jgi:glutamate carboxypeptidase